MAGGSEDLWADTLPWTLGCIDLSALFPPWSGVQGYCLTQEPLNTASEQWPHHNSSLLKYTQSALAEKGEEWFENPGLSSREGVQVVSSSWFLKQLFVVGEHRFQTNGLSAEEAGEDWWRWISWTFFSLCNPSAQEKAHITLFSTSLIFLRNVGRNSGLDSLLECL